LYQPEFKMESGGISILRRLSCSLSLVVLAVVAALVLAFDFDGPRTVRAEGAEVTRPSLQEVIVGPVMQTIEGLEYRLRSLEADARAFADSFTSRRIAAQTLCVSDESGAQTCITKAQLDLILDRLAHVELSQPPVTVIDADTASAEPVKVTTTNTEPATEPTVGLADQDAEHTGTAQLAVSGAAVIWTPEVEISVVEPGTPSEE
jgi:hypothetical protein